MMLLYYFLLGYSSSPSSKRSDLMEPQTGDHHDRIVDIPLGDISPSPYQPRVHFDENELKELAASIKEKGVLQPITLRPVEGKDTPYELVMGERRWRASKLAGNETVRSVIKELTGEEARDITLVENLQREDLTPMEEARGIQAHVEAHGGNKSETARAIGKSIGYVDGKLSLLTLPREVQNMLEAGIINEAQCRVILEVESTEKQVDGAKLAQKLQLTATQLRGRLQKHIKKGSGGNASGGEPSGERKPTTFKTLSTSLVNVYEALEGFDFDDLGGDEKGLKNREILRKQTALVRQSLARTETALLPDPPPPKKKDGDGKPPRLSTSAA
jgi:ParB family chromosome partitioning protein